MGYKEVLNQVPGTYQMLDQSPGREKKTESERQKGKLFKEKQALCVKT